MIQLVAPSEQYRESYLEALPEFHAEGRNLEWGVDELRKDFSILLKRLEEIRLGLNMASGEVGMIQLWLVDGDTYLGRLHIRPVLTEALRKVGGNIGYQIRPSERRKGYGTEVLRLGIIEAKKLGLHRLLVTCLNTNTPSRRIIEANGGILACDESEEELRFWIEESPIQSPERHSVINEKS